MSKRLTRAIFALVVVSLTIGVAAMASAQGSSNEFRATMNGQNDHTSSTGRGSATFKISSTGKSIHYSIKASGLSGGVIAAHIHWLPKGAAAGPVMITICGAPCSMPKSGTLTATRFSRVPNGPASFAAAVRAIRAGRTYVNLHTNKFKAGEIRGTLRADT